MICLIKTIKILIFNSSGGFIWKIVIDFYGQDLIFELLKARNEYKEHIDNYGIERNF